VATSSGTTALHIALVACGVGPDDLVVLPSFTFIASANAISHCGAAPWLVDIDKETWSLDTKLLRRCLSEDTRRDGDRLLHRASGRRVAAIMPIYTLGSPSDMDAIVAIAREFGLRVVADAAAALGATYRGRALGQLGADLSGISFNGNKTVTSGGGGAVIGTDPELLRLVRHLCATARTSEEYVHDRVGYNYRMTNLQAAVGCAQMERLPQMLAAKRRIWARYERELKGLRGLGPLPLPPDGGSACWLAGITLSPPAPPPAELQQMLRERGIEARTFWKPVHRQPPYRDAPASPMPVAEAVWPTVLSLPCSTDLSEGDQGRVIAALHELLS
jgi:dTDP-4-amino-4,6-dideoxygalactose transaminase